MAVKFEDFSIKVKAALDETSIAWLYEASNEIKSQTQRDVKMEDDAGKQLKGSYSTSVNEGKGEAQIGTPLEQGYWEEWGTGSHAAHGDGRKGWWVYVKGSSKGNGGKTYSTQQEAQAIANNMRADGLEAYATNGREPNYTLERAFGKVKPKAKARLESLLKERMNK